LFTVNAHTVVSIYTQITGHGFAVNALNRTLPIGKRTGRLLAHDEMLR